EQPTAYNLCTCPEFRRELFRTINKAALSVTADADTSTAAIDQFTKTYGDPNPTFTVRYSGFVGTDGPGSLGGTLAFDTLASQYSDTGTYTVTPKGLTSGNYAISFVDGSLKVHTAALSVRADADS